MPVLGFGTFQIKGEDCRNAVKIALRTGYRHIDTAQMYNNEQEVGKGIKDATVPRDKIFLTTKLKMGQLEPAGVRASCESSLLSLDTDYIDLLLIHWPEESVPLHETLEAMEHLKQEGKIRHLGVSNFTVAWLHLAMHATEEQIFCNQIEYHPYLDQTPPIEACRGAGIGVVAYSPLARGKVQRDETLFKIGQKHAKTPSQIALRWLIEQPGVIAIPKASSETHIRENFAIWDFELDKEDRNAINSLPKNNRLIDPDFAPTWDT